MDVDSQDPVTSAELITAHLAGRLSLDEATSDLLGPVNAVLSSSSESENEKANILLFDLWHCLFDIVAIAPSPMYTSGVPDPTNIEYLSNLVTLVDSIHDPLPTGQYSWFSPEARDRWNFAPTTPPITPEQVAGWTNLNSFLMLCWTLHPEDRDRPIFEFSLNSIWSLRLALETSQKPAVLDALVPGAACWIVCRASGERIYNSAAQWTPDENVGAPARAGRLWRDRLGEDNGKDVNGFSRQRWAFWRQRFTDIGQTEEVNEQTRQTAKSAAKVMEDIERTGGR